jgi:hypothetical protein
MSSHVDKVLDLWYRSSSVVEALILRCILLAAEFKSPCP